MSSNQNIYPKTSPYTNTSIVDNKYLDVMQYPAIGRSSSDLYYVIPAAYQYRPDMLAYDLYNDQRLWWVFAARNPNTLGPDPYFNFIAGIGIYVPTLSTLRTALGI